MICFPLSLHDNRTPCLRIRQETCVLSTPSLFGLIEIGGAAARIPCASQAPHMPPHFTPILTRFCCPFGVQEAEEPLPEIPAPAKPQLLLVGLHGEKLRLKTLAISLDGLLDYNTNDR